jgi:hypothetical protein
MCIQLLNTLLCLSSRALQAVLTANALPPRRATAGPATHALSLSAYISRALFSPLLSDSLLLSLGSLLLIFILGSEVERTAGGAPRLATLLTRALVGHFAVLFVASPPWTVPASVDDDLPFYVGQAALIGALAVALAQAKVPHAGPTVAHTPGTAAPTPGAPDARPPFALSAAWLTQRRVFITIAGSAFVFVWPTGWAVQWFPALLWLALTTAAAVTGAPLLWTSLSFAAGAWCAWFHIRFREVSGGLRGDARSSMGLGAFVPGTTLGSLVDSLGGVVYTAALSKDLVSPPTGPPVALLALHESPAPRSAGSRLFSPSSSLSLPPSAPAASSADSGSGPSALDRRRRLAAAALARLEEGDGEREGERERGGEGERERGGEGERERERETDGVGEGERSR